MKSIIIFMLIILVACNRQNIRQYPTNEDLDWVVNECNQRFPEPKHNALCIYKLNEALTNEYAKAQKKPRWVLTIGKDNSSPGGYDSSYNSEGIPVYRADECAGPIVNGKCHGSIIPKSAVHEKCYGEMLNGVCTGPQF
jgi:hypothetical protein